MLALSFPRLLPQRWTLLFDAMRRSPRRVGTLPGATDDLMSDAEALLEAGYRVAAAMVARAAVERSLVERARRLPEWDHDHRGLAGIAAVGLFMRHHRALTKREFRQVQKIQFRGNCAAHGRAISDTRAANLVLSARQVVDALARKAVLA